MKTKRCSGLAMRMVAAILMLLPTIARASSHREAPLITTMPKVDGADFYMFNSYEPGRAGFVTIVADYQPLEDPFAGPNYYTTKTITLRVAPDGKKLSRLRNQARGWSEVRHRKRIAVSK